MNNLIVNTRNFMKSVSTNRVWRRVICVLMALVILLTTLLIMPFARTFGSETISDAERIVDPDTTDSYISQLNLAKNSLNAGQVWSDKSVFTGDVELDNDTDGYSATIKNDSDFLHVYSALGSSLQVNGYSPVDLMISIDITSSMLSNYSESAKRDVNDRTNWKDSFTSEKGSLTNMTNVLTAANDLISSIRAYSSYSRISVVVYWGTGYQMIPFVNGDVEFTGYSVRHDVSTSNKPGNPEAIIHYTVKNSKTAEVPSGDYVYDPVCGAHYVYPENKAPENDTYDGTSQIPYNGKLFCDTGAGGKDVKPNGTTSTDANSISQIGGGTDVEAGIYTAMNIVANMPKKEVKFSLPNGEVVNRIPAVIILGDGATNHVLVKDDDSDKSRKGGDPAVSSMTIGGEWWNPTSPQKSAGTNGSSQAANFAGAIQGAYWKSAIKNTYERKSVSDVLVYTIGVNASPAVLDPGDAAENSLPKAQFDAWKVKTDNSTFDLAESAGGGYDAAIADPYSLKRAATTYKFKRLPETDPYGIKTSDLDLNYPTTYYPSSSKEELQDIFTEISNNIANQIFSPVGGLNDSNIPAAVTYQDPIGQYMEVKDVKNVLLFGELYDISKTALYDYNVANSPDFREGWYNADGEPVSSGSWDNGDAFYLNSQTAATFVPTLADENQLNEQQKNTVYTFYRFSNSEEEYSKYRWNQCYGEAPSTDQTKLEELYNRGDLGVYRLSDVRIWTEYTGDFVDENGSGGVINLGYEQALYVNIPRSVLPLQVASVDFNGDSEVVSYKTNLSDKAQSTPLRVFYTVGVQEEILTEGGSDIDVAKLSQEYLANHKDENGNIYFLSNYYSETTYKDYQTTTQEFKRGDPFVTISPSNDNSYYLFQSNKALYSVSTRIEGRPENVEISDDAAFESFEKTYPKVSSVGNSDTQLNGDSWYYVINDYYDSNAGNGKYIRRAVAYKGSELGLPSKDDTQDKSNLHLCWYDEKNQNTADLKISNENGGKPSGSDWIIAVKSGSPKIGDMSQGVAAKSKNETDTANNYFLPIIKAESEDDIVFDAYLGNNGRLSISDTMLLVTKTVDINENLSYSNKEYAYQAYIEGFTGKINAIVVTKNPYTDVWQRRISTIDILTDNNELLQNADNTLVRADASGNIDPQGDYYIYVGHNTESGDTGSEYALRIYDSELNHDDITINRGGLTTYVPDDVEITDNPSAVTSGEIYKRADKEHPVGSFEFWISDVYLVPISDVENSAFNKDDYKDGSLGSYKKLIQFPVVTLEPTSKGSYIDLESAYSVRTEYLTKELDFGAEGLTLYDTNSFKPGDLEVSADKAMQYTAEFTLKDGEGLLFRGISSGADYRFTEKLQDYEIDSGYAFNHVDHETQSGTTTYTNDGSTATGSAYRFDSNAYTYSVFGDTSSIEEAVHYTNEFNPVQMTVSKTLAPDEGAQIKPADYEKSFEFTIKLAFASGEPIDGFYWFRTFSSDGDVVSEEEKELNSEGVTSFRLKGGQHVVIYGLPVGAKYTYNVSEADQVGWTPQITVDGILSKNADTGYTGSLVQNGEKLDGSNLQFTNVKSAPVPEPASLTAKKVVNTLAGASYTLKENDFSFMISPFKDNPEDDPIAKDTVVTNKADGSIILFDNVYFGTDDGVYRYTVKELKTKLIPGMTYDETQYTVTVTVKEKQGGNGYIGLLTPTVQITKNSTGETVSAADFTFTNVYKETGSGNLSVTKTVDKYDGTDNTTFNFTVRFTGTELADTITAVRIDGQGSDETLTINLTKVADKSYTCDFTLKDGQTITFINIPDGTSYSVSENMKGIENQYFLKNKTGDTGAIKENTNSYAAFVNAPYVELPDFGGIGTIPFYVFGTLVIVIAGASLVYYNRKRRIEKQK